MSDEILIASDHAGFELKQKLERELEKRGMKVRDMGTNSSDSTDYPDYAHPLASEVSKGTAKRGVLICGTGLGMSYVANRYPNVRAAVTWSPEVAELARSHNDANVLVLPARFVDDDLALKILDKWFTTPFDGGRHVRRVEKIDSEMADLQAEAAAGHNGLTAQTLKLPSPQGQKLASHKASKRVAKAAKPSSHKASKRGGKAAKPKGRTKRGGK
jgi:ribose 5-phosphate isomerase B